MAAAAVQGEAALAQTAALAVVVKVKLAQLEVRLLLVKAITVAQVLPLLEGLAVAVEVVQAALLDRQAVTAVMELLILFLVHRLLMLAVAAAGLNLQLEAQAVQAAAVLLVVQ
jgi:hypothetical protein